jgi:hypothetical protein
VTDDIVETLRECAEDSRKTEGDYYADQFATDASVFEDAANEIERLRNGALASRETVRLTDEEREAIEESIKFAFPASHPTATTLRNLLQRTK